MLFSDIDKIIDGTEKPLTKADIIRAMSDDELAKFICEWCNCVPGYCPGVDLCTPSTGKANGLVKWLKQPAEVPEGD